MSYTRFQLGFTRSPKVSALSDAAFRLWVSLIDYAREQRTDGQILPLYLSLIPHCPVNGKARQELIDSLVNNRLLDQNPDGGWLIHDFLDWQDSSDIVDEKRKKAAERMRNVRANKMRSSREVRSGDHLSSLLDLDLSSESEKEEESLNSNNAEVKPDLGKQDQVKRVFEFWKKLFKHPTAKLDEKRRKRICARLNDGFTPEQLRDCMLGASKDPFLMGTEKGAIRKYDGIETIFRDVAQVERLIELHKNRVNIAGTASQTPEETATKQAEFETARANKIAQDKEFAKKLLGETIKTEYTPENLGKIVDFVLK